MNLDWGLQGYIVFLISAQNIGCGYLLKCIITLVNVYVDLQVVTPIAGTL